MTMIHEVRPDVVGELDAPEIEVLFAEARQRARRRRLRRGAIAAGVVGALIAAAVIVRAQDPVRRQLPHPAVGKASVSAAFPSTFVGYDAHETLLTSAVGGIKLFSTKTGKALRTIVPITTHADHSTNFSGLNSGFVVSADASTVYYAETVSNSRPVRIVAAPVNGGASRVLVTGADPAVSADDRLLAYRPGDPHATDTVFPGGNPVVGILDLKTGQKKIVTIPGMKTGQGDQFAWLPGSTKLLIAATDVETNPLGGEVGQPIPVVHDPRLTSRTQLYDTTTGRFTTLPAATTAALEETLASKVTLIGPSDSAGVVQVSGLLRDAGSTPVHEAVGTLDVHTGRLAWQATLPAGFGLAWPAGIADQFSGRHFLLQGQSGLEVVYAWTPSSGEPPRPLQATMDTTGISPFG